MLACLLLAPFTSSQLITQHFLFEHNVGSAFYCMHVNNQLIFFEIITGINVSLLVKEECQFIDAVGSPILTEQSTVTYQNNQLQEQKKY